MSRTSEDPFAVAHNRACAPCGIRAKWMAHAERCGRCRQFQDCKISDEFAKQHSAARWPDKATATPAS